MKDVLLPLNLDLNDVEVADIIRIFGTKSADLLRQICRAIFPFNTEIRRRRKNESPL